MLFLINIWTTTKRNTFPETWKGIVKNKMLKFVLFVFCYKNFLYYYTSLLSSLVFKKNLIHVWLVLYSLNCKFLGKIFFSNKNKEFSPTKNVDKFDYKKSRQVKFFSLKQRYSSNVLWCKFTKYALFELILGPQCHTMAALSLIIRTYLFLAFLDENEWREKNCPISNEHSRGFRRLVPEPLGHLSLSSRPYSVHNTGRPSQIRFWLLQEILRDLGVISDRYVFPRK